MAMALAMAGARVGVLGRRRAVAEEVAAQIQARGGETMALPADVLDRDSLVAARESVIGRWGGVHILVNAAGGNMPGAVLGETADVFTMSAAAFKEVVDLNLSGTLIPSLVFGEAIVQAGGGAIFTISSLSPTPPLPTLTAYPAPNAP